MFAASLIALSSAATAVACLAALGLIAACSRAPAGKQPAANAPGVAAAAPAPAAPDALWQPSPGHVQIPIWPGTPPDLAPDPMPESGASTHVSRPTMTVYAPQGRKLVEQWLHTIGMIGPR